MAARSRRPLLRLVATVMWLLLPPLVHVRPASGQEVQGRLLEAGSRKPILLAVVTLLDSMMVLIDRTYTDHTGHFSLRSAKPGSYYVAAAATGYIPRVDGRLEMPRGSSMSVELLLRMSVMRLDSIAVDGEARSIRGDLSGAGFFERMQQGFGHFITPEMLQKRPALNAMELLRDIAGVQMRGSGLRGTVAYMRGGDGRPCLPHIFVDGARAAWLMPGLAVQDTATIEDIVDVTHLQAVEVYPRVAQAPMQYASLTTCGVILFWTRRRDEPALPEVVGIRSPSASPQIEPFDTRHPPPG
jgi:hypothetical protein